MTQIPSEISYGVYSSRYPFRAHRLEAAYFGVVAVNDDDKSCIVVADNGDQLGCAIKFEPAELEG